MGERVKPLRIKAVAVSLLELISVPCVYYRKHRCRISTADIALNTCISSKEDVILPQTGR
jgi:hypothetical protein